jgi:ankyrin repeat protein
MEVVLTIVKARGLDAKDKSGTSDPYVTLTVDGKSKETKKTQVVKKTLAPEFNEVFPIHGAEVVLQMSDWNALGGHTWMGEMCIELRNPGISVEAWIKLQPRQGVKKSKKEDELNARVKGELLVRFDFPQNEKLVAAVVANEVETAKQLMQLRGASANCNDKTLLEKCISSQMASLLLRNGADVADPEALIRKYAVQGWQEALETLLNFYPVDLKASTVLEEACSVGEATDKDLSEIAKLLLKFGASPSAACMKGAKIGSATRFVLLIGGAEFEANQRFLDIGPAKTADMEPVLVLIERWIQHGGDLGAQDEDGYTLLHDLCSRKCASGISLVLPHLSKESINALGGSKSAKYKYPAISNCVETVSSNEGLNELILPLLLAGADPNLPNHWGDNIFDTLCKSPGSFADQADVIFHLRAAGCEIKEKSLWELSSKGQGYRKGRKGTSGPPSRYELLQALSNPVCHEDSIFEQKIVSVLNGNVPPGLSGQQATNALDWAARVDNASSVRTLLEQAGNDAMELLTRKVTEVGWWCNPISTMLRENSVRSLQVVLEVIKDLPKLFSRSNMYDDPFSHTLAPVLRMLAHIPNIPFDGLDEKGELPIGRHLLAGQYEEVKALLEHGSDPNFAHSTAKISLLHAVAQNGLFIVAPLLLNAPKFNTIDALDATGESALVKAAYSGHAEIVRLLIEKGADLESGKQHETKRSALECAVASSNSSCARFLINAGAKLTPDLLQVACEKQMAHVVKLLVQKQLKPTPACMLACAMCGDVASAGEIFKGTSKDEKMAMVNARDSKTGETVFIKAVAAKHMYFAMWALARGADVNASDNHGTTPLTIAKDSNNSDMLSWLQSHGAKTSAREKKRVAVAIGWQVYQVMDLFF